METKSRTEQRLDVFANIVCERWKTLDPNEKYYLFHGMVIALTLAPEPDFDLIEEMETLRDLSSQAWERSTNEILQQFIFENL